MAPSRKPVPEPVATALRAFLGQHSDIGRLRVALSGGRDSTVLLHALSEQDPERRARPMHVHHGLHPRADEQAEHCLRFAANLGYACTIHAVRVPERPAEGIEAAARRLRYQALAEGAGPEDCILTAHHAGDQAETFLLAALKGSGPTGLAAMPQLRRLGPCWLGRPLLGVPSLALADYAALRDLRWIEDPSNEDRRFDRNFLRHELLPRCATRFPVERRLAQAAEWQAEVMDILDGLLDPILAELQGPEPRSLDLQRFSAQPPARRPWLLRRFLACAGAPRPRRAPLLEFLRQLEAAGSERSPALNWAGHALRSHRRVLYLLRPADLEPPVLPSRGLAWPVGARELRLPDGRVLTLAELQDAGVNDSVELNVGFRQGGEWLRQRDGTRRALKHLMQERGIPPWRRSRIPLIWSRGELVAVLWDCQ